MHSPFNEYKKIKVENATDLESVVLLYDEIILHLTHAKEHFMEDKNGTVFKEDIEAACMIIRGLTLILDFDKGGEIAQNLCSLYNYMDKRLLVAKEGIIATAKYCEEIIALLSPMRDSWDTVAQEEKKKMEANKESQQPLSMGNLEITI